MIFLYALDYVANEGSLEFGYAQNSSTVDNSGLRVSYLFTNYEREIAFPEGDVLRAMWPNLVRRPDALRLRLPDGTPAATSSGEAFRFVPMAVEHSGLRLDGEQSPGATTLSIPLEHPLAQLYARDFPAGRVYLTIWSLDTPSSTPRVLWVGVVESCEFAQPMAKLECQHIRKLFERVGLTAGHPRTCPKVLYSSPCGVRRDESEILPIEPLGVYRYFKYREDGLLASISPDGRELTIPEAANRPDGYFANGFVILDAEYPLNSTNGTVADNFGRFVLRSRILAGQESLGSPGNAINGGYRRSIVSHVGAVLRLDAPLLVSLPAGTRATVLAGCDKALTTCETKFGNVPRYGGYPFIPLKNPFESGIRG